MTIQVAKVISKGILTIVYNDEKVSNRFSVKYRRNGHVKTIGNYADFGSALLSISDTMRENGTFYNETIGGPL